MKQKITIALLIIIAMPIFLFGQSTNNDPLLDKKMAEKYGLKVPPPITEMDSAADWVLNADMITWGGKNVWNGYKTEWETVMITRKAVGRDGKMIEIKAPHLKPSVTEGTIDGEGIKGVSLISHAPISKDAFDQAHKKGFHVIPYVHFTCINNRVDQDVTILEHPEILVKDNKGQWLHMPMDGTYRLHRFLTCANSPSYWKLTLAYVKKIMDMGADGVFIDNVHDRRDPCMAPTFNEENEEYPGFRAWQHPSLEPYRILYDPEFGKYQHEHLFPDATHDYAYDRMLQAIRALVKSYGEDKIVVLNSGIQTPFQKNGDICMWESFIYSWAWEGRGSSWDDVKKFMENNKKYTEVGGRITGLSYLQNERKEVKEDAFWAFTCARLTGMIWWTRLNGTGAEILYSTHLGESLQSFQERDGIVTRTFENGILVLNNNKKDEEIEINLPKKFKQEELKDIFDGKKTISVKDGKFRVNVPGDKARVYYKIN